MYKMYEIHFILVDSSIVTISVVTIKCKRDDYIYFSEPL